MTGTGVVGMVMVMPMGHRCGYVGVPSGHRLYGVHYDKLYSIDCHGGLTFAEEGSADSPFFAGYWWIGS